MSIEQQLEALEPQLRQLARAWKPYDQPLNEAMQDARIWVLDALRGREVENLHGFVFMVLRNRFASELGRRKREQRRQQAEQTFADWYYAPAPKNTERAVDLHLLRRALQSLPAETRFALESVFGMTQEGEKAKRYVCKRLNMTPERVGGMVEVRVADKQGQVLVVHRGRRSLPGGGDEGEAGNHCGEDGQRGASAL